MIHIFRKEIRKWHAVLWIVLISLGLSSITYLFQRGSHFGRARVASVNGDPISYNEFKSALAETQQRLESVRRYARMFGISEETILKMYFKTANPHEIALDLAIREKLMDQAKKPLNIHISNEKFMDILVNSMPDGLIDERGRLNMSAYGEFLRNMGLSPEEYESRREAEMSRQVLEQFMLNSSYFPRYAYEAIVSGKHIRKNFNIVVFPYEHYLAEAKKETVSPDLLKRFYDRYKEDYRLPEQKKANFWRINPREYAKNVVVSDDMVNAYYQKNKSSQFRIAPKVRVRRLLLADQQQAKNVYHELKDKPETFVDKVKTLSQDKETAAKGGLTDLFSRGSLEKAVEDAAFRLNQEGEISDVIKTSRGFEILQLAERIGAKEKPLEEVREQIVTALTSKRALEKLKSDLETLLHEAREDSNVINDFARKHGLTVEKSHWLTKESINKHDVSGQLADRLFSSSNRLADRGYFFDGASYVIYQLAEIEKSRVKSFDEVAKDVEQRFFEEKGSEMLEKAVKTIRAEFQPEKVSLEDLAKQKGLRFIKTGLIGSQDQVKGIKDFKEIAPRVFQLNDPSLILQVHTGKDIALVQLQHEERGDVTEEEIQSEIRNEDINRAHNHMNSFIASLQRNARIERFDAEPSKNIEPQELN